MPTVSPQASRPAGLRAKVVDPDKFRERMLEVASRYSASISFQATLVRFGVSPDKQADLKKALDRVIFEFLSDTGTDIRIEITSP